MAEDTSLPQPPYNVIYTTSEGNDVQHITGRNANDTIPPWLDDRLWVRTPALLWHRISPRYTFWEIIVAARKSVGDTYFNFGLPLIPLGLMCGILEWNVGAVFGLNLLALIPLSKSLSLIIEEMLLSSASPVLFAELTIPHLLPLIIGTVAIRWGEIQLAQSFIVGSILSDLLLGLGGSFLAGGIRQLEQSVRERFVPTRIETTLVLVTAVPIAMCSMLSRIFSAESDLIVLVLSHGVSFILLDLYVLWQYFRYYSHSQMYPPLAMVEQDYRPRLRLKNLALFAAVTICSYYCSAYVIHSVNELVAVSPLTRGSIGFILLPAISNAPRYFESYAIAYGSRPGSDMNVAISLTLAFGVGAALCDLPILVIFGWITRTPMTMELNLVETMLVEICLFLMSGLNANGEGIFMKGAMCLALYSIIVLTYTVMIDI